MQEGETYLYFPYAYDLIDDCARNNLAVTAVEAYFIETGNITGRIDESFGASSFATTSWEEFRDASNKRAREYVDTLTLNPRLMFKLNILTQEELYE